MYLLWCTRISLFYIPVSNQSDLTAYCNSSVVFCVFVCTTILFDSIHTEQGLVLGHTKILLKYGGLCLVSPLDENQERLFNVKIDVMWKFPIQSNNGFAFEVIFRLNHNQRFSVCMHDINHKDYQTHIVHSMFKSKHRLQSKTPSLINNLLPCSIRNAYAHAHTPTDTHTHTKLQTQH